LEKKKKMVIMVVETDLLSNIVLKKWQRETRIERWAGMGFKGSSETEIERSEKLLSATICPRSLRRVDSGMRTKTSRPLWMERC